MKKFISLLLGLVLLLSGCALPYSNSDDEISELQKEPVTENVVNQPITQPENIPEPEPQPESEPITDENVQTQEALTLPPATESRTFDYKDAYLVGFTDDMIILRPQGFSTDSYIGVSIDTTSMDLVKNEIFYFSGTMEPLETPIPFPNDNGKYPIRYTMDKSCIVGRMFNAESFSQRAEIIYKEKDFVVFTFAKRNIKVYCDAEKYCVDDWLTFEGSISKIEPQKITLNNGKEKTVKYEIKNAKIIEDDDIMVKKPVIYLYPQKTTDVTVSLDFDGKLVCTYPDYNGLWQVTAQPDGTLTDKAGREYYCLYWEGDSNKSYLPDDNIGYMVKGEDTAEFLRKKALELGLNQKEANEFIIYWLPLMQNNAYNYIYFSIDEYCDAAKLNISPAPDTVIRFSMVWKGLDKPYHVTEQILPKTPVRTGFTVVEWGGVEIK